MATSEASKQQREYESVQEQLTTAGIKPTAQRIAICQYVLQQRDHASVEEVKAWVDNHFPKISLATVYNTLNLLVDAGMLKAIRLPESEKVHYDSNVATHCHFLDKETGTLEDLDPASCAIKNNLPDEYKIEDVQVLLTGHKHP